MSVFEIKGAPAPCGHNLAVGCMGFPRFEYLHMECAPGVCIGNILYFEHYVFEVISLVSYHIFKSFKVLQGCLHQIVNPTPK